MIKRKSLFIAVFFLLMGAVAYPFHRSSAAHGNPSRRAHAATAAPHRSSHADTCAPDMPPTETATTTPQPPSAQQPFSITLQVGPPMWTSMVCSICPLITGAMRSANGR